MIEWLTQNWGGLLEALIAVIVVAGGIVGMINGPKAEAASGWIAKILALLRRFSPVTYKDEPGTLSVPLVQGDSKKRIKEVEEVR